MENQQLDYNTATSVEFVLKIGTVLRQKLVGKLLIECFSQNKDELMFGFGNENNDFWIKANFDSEIALMCFPENFSRAKKNTIELFREIKSQKVISLLQHSNERSFHLEFENNFQLLFKLHGKNSNLILFEKMQLKEVFRNNLLRDFNIDLHAYTIDNEKFIDQNLIHSINIFYQKYVSEYYLSKEKKQALAMLHSKINATKKYIYTASEKLLTLHTTTNYQQIADVLMANLHQNIQNYESIELYNFYTNATILIKLKSHISLIKNAENYYRKSKNQKIELLKIAETVAKKKTELEKFEAQKIEIDNLQDIKSTRVLVETNQILVPKQKLQISVPYTEFIFDNYKIWIGKNAQQNYVLTLKYAHKEDLWLHAKDCPGSHVILKNQAGKNFPKNVIEKAASIAAWYSKKKTEGLVSVIVTPKKYVRKIKGSAPGNVVVEHEKVILVVPQNYAI